MLVVDDDLARRSPAICAERIVIARCLNGHTYVLAREDLTVAVAKRPGKPGRPCRGCGEPITISKPWDSLRVWHPACLAEKRKRSSRAAVAARKDRLARRARGARGRFMADE